MARTDPRPSKNHTPQIHAYRALLTATRGIVTPCDDGQGTEWFSDDEQQQQRAAQLCQTCPAIQACAAYAITAGETTGVWGGTTPDQRRALAQQPDQPGTAHQAPRQTGTAHQRPSYHRRAHQQRPPNHPATVDQQSPAQPGTTPRRAAAKHHDTTTTAEPRDQTTTLETAHSKPGRAARPQPELTATKNRDHQTAI